MAGKEEEGKLALGRCTAATCEEASTKRGTLNGCTARHKSAADGEPMELVREDAEEEIYKILDVAATSEVTEPVSVDLAKAEGEIKEAVSDEAEDYYQDDAEYDGEFDYEEEEYDYEAQSEEDRRHVKAMLLSFPEAEKLEPHELHAAVDRLLEYDNVAAPGNIRLLRKDISIALNPWTAPPPSIVHNWCPNHTLSADSIRMYEELDKEFLPLYGKSEEEQDRERFQAKVRQDLIEKGYVEVDEDYYEKKDEYERQCMQKIKEEWNQQMLLRRSRFANIE